MAPVGGGRSICDNLPMNEIEFTARLHDKIQSFTQTKIETLDPQTLLFSSGLIDSLTIVEIIVLVEQYWDIQVDPSDLSMDNFDSLQAITGYVERKRRGEA
jgi:acyl carrier protein